MKLIIFTGLVFFCSLTGKSLTTEELIKKENSYIEAQAYVLCSYLKKKYPNPRVLIAASPDYKKNNFLLPAVKAIKEYFKDAVIDTPYFQDPLFITYTAKSFNALEKKHPECNMVISTIGLPEDPHKMTIWMTEKKFALFNGDITYCMKAIQAGLIKATVSYKPGVKFTEDPCPKDPQKAFDRRCLLVTPDNVNEVAKQYPNLFSE